MTDYNRTTTTRQTVVQPEPAQAPYVAPAAVPAAAQTVSTTDTAVVTRPDGATTAARIVTFAFGILQALLILRVVLLLLVANPNNGVVGLILGVTQPFVEPFLNMFALDRVRADQGSIFDVAALVALIAWTLVEALILAAIRIFARRPETI